MPALLNLYQRWGPTKPPAGTPLLSGHSLAAGLVAAWPINDGQAPVDVVTGRRLTPSGTGATPGPWGVRSDGTAYWSGLIPSIANGPFTIALAHRPVQTNLWLVSVGTVGANDQEIHCKAGPDNLTFNMFFDDLTASSLTNPDHSEFHVAYVLDNAKSQSIYKNGVVVANRTASAFYSGTTDLSLSRRATDGSNFGWGDFRYCYIWRRALQQNEIQFLAREPYAFFARPSLPRFAGPTANQLARPISDVSSGSWTASTGSDLYAMLDETVADDTDYIISPSAPANAEAKVRLGPLTDPAVSTGHVINYRFYKTPDGSARGDLTVTLYAADGTTSIASNVHTNVATGVVAGTFTLAGAEADAIPSADYATGLVIGVKAHAP